MLDASYQVSVQTVSEENFKNQPIRKKELHVAAMFVNGSGEMSNLYRGPSIDASYQA